MPEQGLVDSINEIRNLSDTLYQNTVPEIDTTSSIDMISAPLLQYPNLLNQFINVLVQKVAYSQLENKIFRNPLKILEGDNIPLGTIGEEIYINPAIGRDYNIDDFAGLLKKYEADVKGQYQKINLDEQYPVTIIRQELKKAFVSWNALKEFITNITNSLYNGAYIRQYQYSKNLVTNAYRENAVQIKVLPGINTKELAEQFVEEARTLFLNFQSPSTNYNAWNKVGGYGRAIISWSNPEDIVFLIRNDIQSKLDVQILAKAFNVDSTKLLGKIIPVDNFDIYDREYNKIFDGSNILGIMCDRSWFKIKEQDMYMDDFKNANNRSITYYLNVIKMYKYSFFANAVVFATKEPETMITGLDFKAPEGISLLNVGDEEGLDITVLPYTGNTPKIEYESDNEEIFIVEADPTNDRHCKITAIGQGEANLTAKSGNISTTVKVTVENA